MRVSEELRLFPKEDIILVYAGRILANGNKL